MKKNIFGEVSVKDCEMFSSIQSSLTLIEFNITKLDICYNILLNAGYSEEEIIKELGNGEILRYVRNKK